jgi:hypothetical protein
VKRTILYLAFLAVARADFSDDQVPASPDILPRLIASAQEFGDPFAPNSFQDAVYYLRSADYVGSSDGASGVVHVAHFFFTRSAPRGTKLPARGHDFVAFFDSALRLRHFWRVEHLDGRLRIAGTKLYLAERELLDFARTSITGSSVIRDTPPELK